MDIGNFNKAGEIVNRLNRINKRITIVSRKYGIDYIGDFKEDLPEELIEQIRKDILEHFNALKNDIEKELEEV